MPQYGLGGQAPPEDLAKLHADMAAAGQKQDQAAFQNDLVTSIDRAGPGVRNAQGGTDFTTQTQDGRRWKATRTASPDGTINTTFQELNQDGVPTGPVITRNTAGSGGPRPAPTGQRSWTGSEQAMPPAQPQPSAADAATTAMATGQQNAITATQGPEGTNSVDSLLSEMRGISDAAAVTRDPAAKARLEADAQRIRDQVDNLLASPLQSQLTAEQMAAENRAQALSARGGAGAQQQAMLQAQNRLPALQAEAAKSASAEQQQRAATASGMLQNAANVEASSTAFDLDVAKANQDAATNFVNQMGQLGFGELQLNQQDRHAVGQLIRDFTQMIQQGKIDMSKLSLIERQMLLDDATKRYGISEQARVGLKDIAEREDKDFWDKLGSVGSAVNVF